MNRIAALMLVTGLLACLAGCEHPYAQLSTLQDPKYPILHTSKIALADTANSPTVNLASRLGGESVKEQLQALGFNLVPAAEADFQVGFAVTDKDVPMTYGQTIPTVSTISGAVGPHEVYGTVFADQVVPETRMVNMTELDVTLRRTQDPPIEVWSGRITADTNAAEQYRTAFFRALLERIGETTHGIVQLDSAPAAATTDSTAAPK